MIGFRLCYGHVQLLHKTACVLIHAVLLPCALAGLLYNQCKVCTSGTRA